MSVLEMKTHAIEIFRKNGGQLRMSKAIAHGITRYMLYSLRDKGIIEQVSRGVYRLVDLPPMSNPDLVTVSLRFPNAVICLISALSYHDITTQIPHAVSVAVKRDSRVPSLDHPPIQAHRFSNEAYISGIDNYKIDGVPVKIYSPEKTLADCFKFRNKIGMEVVLEALKLYRSRRRFDLEKLLTYARICRVKNIMMPYLEATI
jgi:predicted transcriptional regulator of viral defense system